MSSLHSNEPIAVPEPGSPVNEKEASAEPEGSAGWSVISVSGASVSIVQVNESGEASTLPAASIARTWKVWEPWPRPV